MTNNKSYYYSFLNLRFKSLFFVIYYQIIPVHNIHHAHNSTTTRFISQVIKNPINDHLPIGCRKYAATFHTENVVRDLTTLATAEGMDEDSLKRKDEPVVLVIGTMARGSVSPARVCVLYTSVYPLISHYDDS